METNFMEEALEEAKKAAKLNEVPVGAVVVHEGKIIARAHNRRILDSDATAHAEILAIRAACERLNRWNLSDCDLYVTLEPCAMCLGAAINARIKNIYFGAHDTRFGACGSLVNLCDFEFNHKPALHPAVLLEPCSKILTDFFKKLRN